MAALEPTLFVEQAGLEFTCRHLPASESPGIKGMGHLHCVLGIRQCLPAART